MKLRLPTLLAAAALALAALAAPAVGATSILDFRGPLMRADGQVRCTLNPSRAQCVSMKSGRVVAVHKDGSITTGFTSALIYAGVRPTSSQYLVAHGGLFCHAGKRWVTCVNPASDSGFVMDGFRASIRQWGYDDASLDDSTPASAPLAPVYYTAPAAALPTYVAPTPTYTAPVYTPAPVYVAPYQPDPGMTYGLISPTTGLVRDHYVSGYTKANGTVVSGYYRSCSTC